MNILITLTAVLTMVVMFLTLVMICFFTIMAVDAIYYSFIKRAALLFRMGRKLKKIAKQQLCPQQREMKGQSLTLDTGVSAFSFKQSLALSSKDYKRIFWSSLPIFVLSVVGNIYAISVLPQLMSGAGVGKSFLFSLYVLVVMFWVCVAFFLPIVLVLYTLLNYRLKKMIQKLECN
ncbi:hypothetical protein [Bartonella gliris]|uniref:hypothetical protein n=1 Tax=Bartonella gliris TaxID=3004109 RepID=UPI00387305E3